MFTNLNFYTLDTNSVEMFSANEDYSDCEIPNIPDELLGENTFALWFMGQVVLCGSRLTDGEAGAKQKCYKLQRDAEEPGRKFTI